MINKEFNFQHCILILNIKLFKIVLLFLKIIGKRKYTNHINSIKIERKKEICWIALIFTILEETILYQKILNF